MKTLIVTQKNLQIEGRWDIDYHLPAEGIKNFKKGTLKKIKSAADLVISIKYPTLVPEKAFKYILICYLNIITGNISNPLDLT